MFYAMEIGDDKKKHFVVIFNLMNIVGLWSVMVAFFASFVAIGVKEWYDYKHPKEHTAEWGDVVAGIVGIGASLPLYLLMSIMSTWARVLIVLYLLGVSCAWAIRKKMIGVGLLKEDSIIYCLYSWLYVAPLVMGYTIEKLKDKLKL